MSTDPFISPGTKTTGTEPGWPVTGEPPPIAPDLAEGEGGEAEVGSAGGHQRFLKQAVGFSAGFLILVFFVFREVKHSQDLFRMNQLVVAADTQRRQWQELERLDEVREACLMAEVFRLQALPRETPLRTSAGSVSARRR